MIGRGFNENETYSKHTLFAFRQGPTGSTCGLFLSAARVLLFQKMPPEICPNCGALVPSKARACPECGADEETAWSDRATAQRLDLPDDEFDYDEFVKAEFGGKKADRMRPLGVSWLWWIVALLLLAAFFALAVRW